MNETTQQLSEAGVSIWLDDLSRERIRTGRLQQAIDNFNIVGVTTNPSIFAAALADGKAKNFYENQLKKLAKEGADAAEAILRITTDDVREACAIFHPIYEKTGGLDGRVSIEVDPNLARDAQGTVDQALALYRIVDCENVMIKIPATQEGLAAITETLSNGISVNVTLIFSLERYREVINAFLIGLEQARLRGHDLATIFSVASFFVSRVDAAIDRKLEDIGSEKALGLRGKAGIANACLAYQIFEESRDKERWRLLSEAGAHVQRPLWASTGVKNPSYPATLYVTELAASETVNTMPEKTLQATAAYGPVKDSGLASRYGQSSKILDEIDGLGISYPDVVGLLEQEGIEKFNEAWNVLTQDVDKMLEANK